MSTWASRSPRARRAGLRDRRRGRGGRALRGRLPQHRVCWRSPRATPRGRSDVTTSFRAHITYSESLLPKGAPRKRGALPLRGRVGRLSGASSSPRAAPIDSRVRSLRTRSLDPHGHGRAGARGARAAGRAPACVRRRAPPAAAPLRALDARTCSRTCRRYRRSGRSGSPTAPRRCATSAAATRTCGRDNVTLYRGSGNWGISYLAGPTRQARRRHGRRAHRRGRRGLAGDPGRLGDGPRPRGLLRRDVRRAGTSGSRSACCSCPRSSTPAGRSGCCTSTCSCWSPASASRTSSSTRARSGRRCRSSTRCSPTSSARMLVAAFRPRRTGEPLVPIVPAAFLVVGIVLLGGLPDRARPHRAAGSATSATAARSAPTGSRTTSRCTWTAARTTSTSTPTGRSTTSPTTRSCACWSPREQQIEASGRLRAAGRPRGRARVRRAHDHRAVPARAAAAARAAPGACSAWRSPTAG